MKYIADCSDKNFKWSLLQKLVFRFLFCYFIIYIFPFPLRHIPFLGSYIWQLDFSLWKWIVPLAAEGIFDIARELPLPNGSGDTTFNYIQVFVYFLIALTATIIWSVVQRTKENYKGLLAVLLILLRYYVAFMMLSYGLSKVFTNQFSSLSLFDLIQTYGNSSPMGLMWNFMEYSDSYTIFSGIMEVLGGLLLLFRRTSKLGALIVFGIMLNVFMMNMSYDIPVKLFSLHLMLMSVFILVPYYKSLINYFVFNKLETPIAFPPYFKSKKTNIIGYAFKAIFVAYVLILFISNQVDGQKQWGKKMKTPALYGLYDVKQHLVNDSLLPPMTTDKKRWKLVVVDKFVSGIVKMDDQVQYLKMETDTTAHTLTLSVYSSEYEGNEFNYVEDGNTLTLEGIYDCEQVKVVLIKRDLDEFLLPNRGFNWINEYPMNR